MPFILLACVLKLGLEYNIKFYQFIIFIFLNKYTQYIDLVDQVAIYCIGHYFSNDGPLLFLHK